jgi:hypothetical protein
MRSSFGLPEFDLPRRLRHAGIPDAFWGRGDRRLSADVQQQADWTAV